MSHGEPGDWRDAPFLVVLYDYTVKNVSFPSDIGTLIAYVLLLLVSWYILLWTARFLLSLVWPGIYILAAFLIYRLIRTLQHEEAENVLLQAVTIVMDAVVAVIGKTLEFIVRFLD